MSIQHYWGLQGPACHAYGAHWFRDWCGGISTSSCRTWCVLYILTSKCAERHNGVHFFDIATSKSDPKLRCFVHFDLEMCFAPERRVISHPSSGLLFDPPEPQIIGKNIVFCDFPTFSRTWIFFLLTLSLSSSLLFSDSSHLCFSSVHILGSLTSKLLSIIFFYFWYFIYYTYFFLLYIYYTYILYIYSYIYILFLIIYKIPDACKLLMMVTKGDYWHYSPVSSLVASWEILTNGDYWHYPPVSSLVASWEILH